MQQVWLDGAGVWAAAPPCDPQGRSSRPAAPAGRRSERERSGSRSQRHQRSPRRRVDDDAQRAGKSHEAKAGAARPPSPPPPPPPPLTGFSQQEDKEASDLEDAGPMDHCPICLTDILLEDRAVVMPCMHGFCMHCIWRWLTTHKRRLCPLCKAKATSVLHDIRPSGEHRERAVPPSPPKQAHASASVVGGGEAPLLQRLQEFLGVPGLAGPYGRQQQHQEQRRRREGGVWTESGSGSSSYGSRQRAATQQGRAAGGGAPSLAPQQGPRPYFWRLQQLLQAGGYRPDGGGDAAGGDASISQEDYVLLWRRQVYDQGLWAEPLSSSSAAGSGAAPRAGGSLAAGTARERRLTEWIDRELRALLQTDDVLILRGFIHGLIAAYGLEAFGSPAAAASSPVAQAAQQARQAAATASRAAAALAAARSSALSSSPAEALRPFLHDAAAHFCHELHCFAVAPFALSAYDRLVQYQRRPEAPAAAAATAPPAGPRACGAARRPSRWDQQAPAPGGRQALQARALPGGGGSASRSRNPSPPPLLPPPAMAGGQQQQQWGPPPSSSERPRELRRGSRSQSCSRRRSRSGSRRRRSSHSQERRRRSRHASSCSRSPGRRRSGGGGERSQRRTWRRHERSGNRERRRPYSRSPPRGRYVAGADDLGDRWGME